MPRSAMRWLLVTSIALISFFAQAQLKPTGPVKHLGPPDPRVSTPEEASAAIRHAYDAISRTGLLVNGNPQSSAQINEIQSQSKIAYQEALSCYQSNNYVAAREQAMASADFSRAVEELEMSVEFGGGAAVPAPAGDAKEYDRITRDLENLEYRLDAIHRRNIPQNVVPSDVASLIQTLILQSTQLRQQARELLIRDQAVRAGHTARAGDALNHAAEHLGNRYFLAAGIPPVPLGPPPGPQRHPPHSPEPGSGQHR